ncbi:MAG: glycosyltransferase family 2 protein [Bilifractor sp.]
MIRQEKTAAIVVTYNRKELLMENIQALQAQTWPDLDILIIDNHSTDGTREMVEPLLSDPSVRYVDTGSNLGGAGGFQYGIRYAAEHGYDYVWVMDDDCIPTPGALAALICAGHKLGGNFGFLSSKVLWKDRTLCTMNIQRETLAKNTSDFSRETVPVVMASFVSLFLPVSVVKKVGLPIKEFFIWTDDWEYTRRISRSYPCYLVNDSTVIHKSRSNIGANIATESSDRLDRFYYLYRNDVYLYRREGWRGFCYEAVRLTGHALRVLAKAPDQKKRRLRMIIKGTKAGLGFRPEIEFCRDDENPEVNKVKDE